jgi:hypothetical protein
MPITSEQLAIYRRFNGDADIYSREVFFRPASRLQAADEMDWGAISSLLQELAMLKRNLVAKEYAAQIQRRLSEMAADQSVADALLEMV